MKSVVKWNDGLDGYKQHHIWEDESNHLHYQCHLEDREFDNNSNKTFFNLANDILESKSFQYVELLYSGGLDSELVLLALKTLKIPVVAVTMRLCHLGYPVNTHDLYYSEKFCRNNNINHRIVDLNFVDFFSSGLYQQYLIPYKIVEPHVATHLWLMEQCQHFPVLAGDYTWPWSYKSVLSPHRLEYSCNDKFLQDHNINGIGNFLNYSYQLNYFMIYQHLSTVRKYNFTTDEVNIPLFKQKLYSTITNWTFEIRKRSYGWENIHPKIFNKNEYKFKLVGKNSIIKPSISWSENMQKLLGGDRNNNDKFF